MAALCALLAAGCVLGRDLLGQRNHAPQAYVPDHSQPVIVCLGDSLTAGDGAPFDQSYPAWLQRQLDQTHRPYRVINAGVSGNRVADGLERLQSDVLAFHPRITIVELGSNDPGHTPAPVWEHQLDTIVTRLQAHGTRVILAGLDEPGMEDIYRQVAARHHIPLVWFIAEVATVPEDWHDLHHPNGAGYRLVMKSFWPVVRDMLWRSTVRIGAG